MDYLCTTLCGSQKVNNNNISLFLWHVDVSLICLVNVILSHMKITCFNLTRLTENNTSVITTWRSWIKNPQKTYFFDNHIKSLFACMAMKYTVHNCFGEMTIHAILTPLQKREIIKETNALAQIQCYLNLFK